MTRRPNVVFILSDDHAAHAISAYGSAINATPQIDRIAAAGMRFDRCFCTNALCTPSRAAILTGTYSHRNGVYTIATGLDNRLPTWPGLLQAAGYQTAVIGKWHLGHGEQHDPRGFDYWNVLDGQGSYHNPVMFEQGERRSYDGYVTDVITDLSLSWLENRDRDRPFSLMVHHKAPHRKWEPDAVHAQLYDDVEIPEPPTLRDDYADRASAAAEARMRIADDLTAADLKEDPPAGLSPDELLSWKYQRYIKDYLRCVASMDDNIGRLLDYLEAEGLIEDTIVIYSSDQGFFLGDHGWYDKRFMYEESLRMPLLVQYPSVIRPGSSTNAMVTNVDFAQTLLDMCGVDPTPDMQGQSLLPVLRGAPQVERREAIYYRFYAQGGQHQVRPHYGVRTDRYKLICYPGDAVDLPGGTGGPYQPEWELFDLETDPHELVSHWANPAYRDVRANLTEQLAALQAELGDTPAELTATGG